MFTKEIKLEAREMLKKDDNLYFPGIWLMLIPNLVLIFGVERLFIGGITDFIVGIVSLIILGFFSCWFITWIANLIYSKKTITKSIPRFKVLIPYVAIYIVLNIIVLILGKLMGNHHEILWILLNLIVTYLISYLIKIFIQIMVIDSTRNNGEIQWGRVLNTSIKAIPKVIIFELSFIPLYLLIGITFGILTFWKLSYMETSCILLLDKIYTEKNDMLRIDKNGDGNQNRSSSNTMYTENSRFN